MTIADALSNSALAPVDAEILLASVLGRDRSWLLAHPSDNLDDAFANSFDKLTERRRKGEPVAYILGEKEFYGRMFHVTPSTLIPRPATELLVEQALRVLAGEFVEPLRDIDSDIVAWSWFKPEREAIQTVIDIGTGSGCISITLACERPDIRVIATDISAEALFIAQKNAQRHNVENRIDFREGREIEPVKDITEPFLLVSNPPYIPSDTVVEHEVADFEPGSALFAGPEGTNVLHPLIAAARVHPFCQGFIVECRIEQALL